MINDWVPLTYTLPIKSQFKDAVTETKALASRLVGGRFLVAARYFISLSVSLPFGLSQKLFEFYTTPISFSYSNMPGPTKPFKFGDTQIHHLEPVGPTIGNLATSMIAISMNGKTSIGICTCRATSRSRSCSYRFLERKQLSFWMEQRFKTTSRRRPLLECETTREIKINS